MVCDDLTGRQRRVLRSAAGRLQTAGSLRIVELDSEQSNSNEREAWERAAAQVGALLEKFVLVRVKFKVKKKAIAKARGEYLAERTGAKVAQVIGHTVLLFKGCELGKLGDDGEGLTAMLK